MDIIHLTKISHRKITETSDFREIKFSGFGIRESMIYSNFKNVLLALKVTVNELWKGVYKLKASHISSWSRPMKVLSNVSVSGNWYKTVLKLYESSYM